MKLATIRSKDLFDPKLNPTSRMDGHFMSWLSDILYAKKGAGVSMDGFFLSNSAYRSWLLEVRKANTFEQVEDLVARVIVKYDAHGYSKLTFREALDPRIVSAVTDTARLTCIQQAELIQKEIQESVSAAARLTAMATPAPIILQPKKTKSNVKKLKKQLEKIEDGPAE